jgi:HAE1 family hydrophobic/amphiphilic exporter-1
MKLVQGCIGYPVTVVVAILLVLLFGGIALTRLPLQMVPTVDRPVITVKTPYPGAAPLEVELQVTDRIEEQLNFVEGLQEITSTSSEGESEVTLKFDWGVNKDIARLDVSEKLGTVQGLPDDVEESIIQATSSDEENPIAWIVLKTSRPINEIRPEAEDVLKVRLERVLGVAGSLFFGGEDREVHVIVDDRALTARGLGVNDVRMALLRENRNVKGGTLDEGKRRYVVRTVGEFTDLADLREMIVSRGEGRPVYLKDVAEIRYAYAKRAFVLRQNGKPSIAFGILRRTGANVVDVVERLKAEVASLNRLYESRDIQLEVVYDETTYIDSSIAAGDAEPVHRGGDRGRGAHGLPPLVHLDGHRRDRDPISVIGTFLVLLGARAHAQCRLARGARVRGGHGRRQRDRRAREHLPADPGGEARCDAAYRRPGGLGRDPRLDAHDRSRCSSPC